jgi:hypothetical protein
MTRERATRALVAAALACSAAALLATPAAGTAPAVTAKSPWQLFPRTKVPALNTVLVPLWTANRVWVLANWGDGGTLASARVSGRRLASFAAQRLSAGDVRGVIPTGEPFLDGRLVLRAGEGRQEDAVATAPLLPGGQLGTSEAVTDDLFARAKEAVPRIDLVGVQSGVRVGRRFVWALSAGETIGIGAKGYQLVCCNERGAAVDLTRLVGEQTLHVRIALDTRGRLWLAWLDHRDYPHAARGAPRILELDRSSLAPRTKPLAAPGLIADRIELACAASCRFVAQNTAGDIVSWAPGEHRPTRVASAWRPRKVVGVGRLTLLAATYRSGQLVVGYHGSKGKTEYFDETVRDEIRVVRGDGRGAGARLVGGPILVANNWPPENRSAPISGPFVYGTFAPTGLLVVEQFEYTPPPNSASPVVGAFVPLRS